GAERWSPVEGPGGGHGAVWPNRHRPHLDADPVEEGGVGENGRAGELHEHRRMPDPADRERVVAPALRREEMGRRGGGTAAPGGGGGRGGADDQAAAALPRGTVLWTPTSA